MKTIELEWGLIPAEVYVYLLSLEGNGYYWPTFGSGVYMMAYNNGHGYQVFYIGQTKKEIGGRLWDHTGEYLGNNPSYYLPIDPNIFNQDIYDFFKVKESPYFKQQASDFTYEQRYEAGRKVLRNTYYLFARTIPDNCIEAEAALQLGLLKKNNLPKLGWFGEKQSTIPENDLIVKNRFLAPYIENIALYSIPKEIQVIEGEIKV